jgi:hypothetical protein
MRNVILQSILPRWVVTQPVTQLQSDAWMCLAMYPAHETMTTQCALSLTHPTLHVCLAVSPVSAVFWDLLNADDAVCGEGPSSIPQQPD